MHELLQPLSPTQMTRGQVPYYHLEKPGRWQDPLHLNP